MRTPLASRLHGFGTTIFAETTALAARTGAINLGQGFPDARDELEAIARVCRDHDLVAVTDEVYEHLVYDGEHVPPATLPGMAERTTTGRARTSSTTTGGRSAVRCPSARASWRSRRRASTTTHTPEARSCASPSASATR